MSNNSTNSNTLTNSDDQEHTWYLSLGLSVLVVIILLLQFLLGFFGNVRSGLWFLNKQQGTKKVHHVLQINLSVAGFLGIFTAVPLLLGEVVGHMVYQRGFGAQLCTVLYSFHLLFNTANLLTMSAIAFDRYDTVTRPFKKWIILKHVKYIVVLIWCTALLITAGFVIAASHDIKAQCFLDLGNNFPMIYMYSCDTVLFVATNVIILVTFRRMIKQFCISPRVPSLRNLEVHFAKVIPATVCMIFASGLPTLLFNIIFIRAISMDESHVYRARIFLLCNSNIVFVANPLILCEKLRPSRKIQPERRYKINGQLRRTGRRDQPVAFSEFKRIDAEAALPPGLAGKAKSPRPHEVARHYLPALEETV